MARSVLRSVTIQSELLSLTTVVKLPKCKACSALPDLQLACLDFIVRWQSQHTVAE